MRTRRKGVSSEESLGDEESSDDVKKLALKRNTNCAPDDSRGNHSSVSALTAVTETSSDETSTRCTLDLFIPPLKNFDGLNNPFFNMAVGGRRLKRASLLSIRPLKTRLSEKDIHISKNGQVKWKKPGRKSKHLASDGNSGYFPNNANFRLMNEANSSAFSLPYSDPKGSVQSYFGIEERVAHGEKFAIRAKRITHRGNVQYLIDWETDKSTIT